MSSCFASTPRVGERATWVAQVCHGLGERKGVNRYLEEPFASASDSSVPVVLECVEAVQAELADED